MVNFSFCGNSKDNPIYPASYDTVISVTSVGTEDVGFISNGIQLEWRDRVENLIGNSNSTHHLNNLVDISAPGYAILVLTNNYQGIKYRVVWGTSTAASHISGTIGLMLSENSSLNSKEVESILKLTSSNLDSIPENNNYINKMGAGRLDAYKAVKMAYKMAQPNDFIEIKNRDFYRDWSFEIKNSPYGIKINNEKFRESIKVDFTARNYIELENTVLEPNSNGSTILSIDPTIPLPSSARISQNRNSKKATVSTSFFDGKIFQLEYFLKNGVQENLDLVNPNDPSGSTSRSVPFIEFTFNMESDKLEVDISGYCNVTSAKYVANETDFEVVEIGATTLSDCGEDEETDYFRPITGNFYMQQPAEKVNYQITENQKGLWLWVDETHQLFFSEKVLSVEENELEKVVNIYPNPSKGIVNIDVESTSIEILEVSIFDIQGREIIKKINNLKAIDISKVSSGVYFLKVKSSNNTSIIKKILKE